MADYNDPKDLDDFAKNTMKKIDTAIRLGAINLFSQVIKKTPVDTGTAKGNWQTEIGKFVDTKIDIRSEEDTIKEVIDKVNKGDIKKGFYLSNNLPYIQKLEYGGYPTDPKKSTGKTIGGFSKQAPQGMVRISMQKVEKDLKVILKDIVSKK